MGTLTPPAPSVGTAPVHAHATESGAAPSVGPPPDATGFSGSSGVAAPAQDSPTHDPLQLAKLTAVLETILQQQIALSDGLAGVVFLGVTQDRMGGLAAQFPPASPQRKESQADLLKGSVLERMERIAFAASSAPRGDRAPGASDSVQLPQAKGMYGEQPRLRVFATPLTADGRCEGACAILTRDRPVNGDAHVLGVLAAVAMQFETYLWREQCLVQTQQKLMLRETVELLDASQRAHDATSMSSVVAQELKRRFGCTRVSLGLAKGRTGFIKLAATSGVDEVDANAPAVEALEAAFEECAAQDSEVVYPPTPQTASDPAHRRVTIAHAHLSASFGPAAIVSLPLRVDGGLVGVVLLERDSGDPFPFAAISLLRLAAETIGPALWTRRMADRGIFAVARDRAGRLARAAVGPRHTAVKIVLMLFIAALLAATLIPVPSRVTASSEVRAAASRTISPPFGGYLSSVSIRPGDVVTKGQLLAEMVTSDLRLQLAQAQGDLASFRAQRDEALFKSDLARVTQFEADSRKASATCELLEDALSRASITSPVDGIVGRGELEQFIQSRVDTSQSLFEIVTSQNITIAYVDERDIQRVKPGQMGRFVSKALPGRTLNVTVERILPLAQTHQGANTYQVELRLTQTPGPSTTDTADALLAAMRPGMTGTVKLEDGWTTTLVRVLRPLIDEARLRFWW